MNTNWIVCYDFETTGTDPYICKPWELAAVPIDPYTLEIKKDEAFYSLMKVDDWDNPEYEETARWHATNKNVKPEEIRELWQSGPSAKEAWLNFHSYLKKYNVKKSPYTRPVRAGHNIINFDDIITSRLDEQFKLDYQFNSRDFIDSMNLCFLFFEGQKEPKSYGMDYLRNYFSMSRQSIAGAHTAHQDVLDVSELIKRFMKKLRQTSEAVRKVNGFKGAFKRESADFNQAD